MVIQVGFAIGYQAASASLEGRARNMSGGSVSDMKLPFIVFRELARGSLSRRGAVLS